MKSEPSSECGIFEGPISIISVKRGSIVGEIGFENVQATVAIEIGDTRSHTCLLASILVECGTCGYRNISESSVTIVVVQNAGSAVAGDVNVRPAVGVEVESRDTERVMAIGAIEVRFNCDIFECTVAAVAIKNVLRAW